MKWWLLVLVAFLITGCSGLTCADQVASYAEEIADPLTKWQSLNEVGMSTSRIALSPLVVEMAECRREIAKVEPPSCAEEQVAQLLAGMDLVMEGWLGFLGKKSDSEVSDNMEVGYNAMTEALKELNALKRR